MVLFSEIWYFLYNIFQSTDIYAVPPHTGRGGWTWYSGSSGLLYTLILECLLGVRMAGDLMRFDPCIQKMWESYKVDYRYRSMMDHIDEKNKIWIKGENRGC